MKRARTWLIVGAGSIARRHAGNLRQLEPGSRIVVLRRTAAAAGAPAPDADQVVGDMATALACKPEAAIVASAAPLHVPDALALCRAGVPALIEKPLAPSVAEARPLLEAAAARGAPAMVVGYPLRHLPSLKRCKELLDSGAVGQLLSARFEVGQYLPEWRPGTDYRHSVSARRELGGGALLELSHELDYCAWLLGAPTHCYAAMGTLSELELDVEDHVELVLRGRRQGRTWLASVHLDMCQRPARRTCQLVGSEGTLRWDALTGRVDLWTAQDPAWREAFCGDEQERSQMYVDELRDFVRRIGQGGDLADAFRVLQIADAARRSAERGSEVAIDG